VLVQRIFEVFDLVDVDVLLLLFLLLRLGVCSVECDLLGLFFLLVSALMPEEE
jgi:hypothetical protein